MFVFYAQSASTVSSSHRLRGLLVIIRIIVMMIMTMMIIIITITTTTIMMMMMMMIVVVVVVVVMIIITIIIVITAMMIIIIIIVTIIELKGAIRDLYNLLTAPRTVSKFNTYAQVTRAQSCAKQVQHIERLSCFVLRAAW